MLVFGFWLVFGFGDRVSLGLELGLKLGLRLRLELGMGLMLGLRWGWGGVEQFELG